MPQMAKRHAAIGEASRFAEVHRYRSAESQGDNLLGQPGIAPELLAHHIRRHTIFFRRLQNAARVLFHHITSIAGIRRELVLSQQPERSVNQRLILFA